MLQSNVESKLYRKLGQLVTTLLSLDLWESLFVDTGLGL